MLPGKDRPAIGRTGLAMLVVVVIVIGGAVGISFPKPGQGAVVTSTVVPSTSASTSSASTSSALNTTTVATSSSLGSIAATPSLTPSTPLFNFVLISLPQRILLAPGANLTYASLSVNPLPSSREVEGNPLAVGSELVVLNATVPSGLHLRFLGSNLVGRIYEEVSIGSQWVNVMNFAADKTTAPGDYTVTVEAASGNYTTETSFTVTVAQYLVIAYTNQFSPGNLTVKAGSTVYWLNLGGNGGDANSYDVTFNTIKVQSPTLDGNLYDSFSYTFTTPGTYTYQCSIVGPIMSGTVTVTD